MEIKKLKLEGNNNSQNKNFHTILDVFLKRIKLFFGRLISLIVGNFRKTPSTLQRISYYFGLWLRMTKNSLMVMQAQKKIFFLFLAGKLIRFTFFTAFLVFLVRGSGDLAGYSLNEAVFFFLTFNLVDVVSQFLYREVYRFRPLVVSGDLDLIMTKPFNTLFRVLMGGTDIIDFVTIPPLIAAVFYIGSMLNPTAIEAFYYLLLIANALIIATAFHIAILGLGIITFEVDYVIWIYRDITNLGRFPVDIYRQPLKFVLTFLVPIGLMISVPVRSFLGLVSFWGVLVSLIFGITILVLSIYFWKYSTFKYKSASS